MPWRPAASWLLAAVPALGAWSDGSTAWLRVIVLASVASVAPIVYLLVLRALGTERRERRERPPRAAQRTHRLAPMDVAPDLPAP